MTVTVKITRQDSSTFGVRVESHDSYIEPNGTTTKRITVLGRLAGNGAELVAYITDTRHLRIIEEKPEAANTTP